MAEPSPKFEVDELVCIVSPPKRELKFAGDEDPMSAVHSSLMVLSVEQSSDSNGDPFIYSLAEDKMSHEVFVGVPESLIEGRIRT